MTTTPSEIKNPDPFATWVMFTKLTMCYVKMLSNVYCDSPYAQIISNIIILICIMTFEY